MANSQSLLQNIYLFKDLTPAEMELISRVAQKQTFNPGDEIFMEGDKAHSLYVIKFGSIKIQRSGKNDRVDVATLGTGSHFGEIAFLDGEKRSASAVAIETTELVSIGFDELKKILDGNATVAVKVYRSLAHFLCGRLRLTTEDLSFAREKNLRHF